VENMDKKKLIQDMYINHVNEYSKSEEQWFGPLSSFKLRHDPKYIIFMLSRYKAASKFLRGKNNILEIGCGDGIGIPILLQEVDKVHGIDLENIFIEDNKKRNMFPDRVKFSQHNITESPLDKKYDGAVSFDVLSSITKDKERPFFKNIADSIDKDGIFIIGTQNKLSTQYSNSLSIQDQENFKEYHELDHICRNYFNNVIILSMNDEVIHIGRETMTQYFIAICITPK